MTHKVVQPVVWGDDLAALCDDGTIWHWLHLEQRWMKRTAPPPKD